MSDPPDDAGTVQTLLDRLVKFRLPRAMEIKQHVDAGGVLSDSEIDFLQRALEDARDGAKYVARHPELHALGTQVVQLYDEIVRKAMENEQRG
jgi:hypothetical protein